MAQVQKMDALFNPERIAGMINKVKGHSSLAILSQQEPMTFVGNERFSFTMDNDINVVGESGAKAAGGVTITKTSMSPIKVEYSARFSTEMWYASEDNQIDIVKSFSEGYAKKLARGIDLMALHGVNPRSKTDTEIIGTNNFDDKVTQTVDYDALKVDDVLEDAIFTVTGSGGVNNGIAMSPVAGRDLSKVAVNGVRQYPEFRMGANPDNLAGMKTDINETVSTLGNTEIYVGDFANAFKWGYSKNIGLEMHTAGDPDNTGRDLAGHNEIMLRSETFLGWGILEPESFARVIVPAGV